MPVLCRLQFRVPVLPSMVKGTCVMLNDREKILTALREKPLKIYEVMKRANLPNEEACQSLLMKMRGEGSVKFDIHKGRWLIG
jgi:DNA-binding IclR family transcriptional regulator